MNWEALGAIGEMVAAIGVIGSLLFVGIQVRRANRDTQAHAAEQKTVSYRDLLLQGMPYANVIMKGGISFSNLPSEQKMQFHLWMTAHVADAQHQYRQLSLSSRDDHSVEALLEFNAMMLKDTGTNEWWQYRKQGLDAEFVAHLDQLIEETIPLSDVWPWLTEEDS